MPKRKMNLLKRVNRLERVARPEVKFRHAESSDFDTIGSNTGTLLKPMQTAEGVGRNNRIGDKVKTRNIRFQAVIKMPQAAASQSCGVRIVCLRSKIQDPATSDMTDWYKAVDEDKFFVVKDILTQVSCRSVDSNDAFVGTTLRRINFNIPTGLRKLQYDGDSLQSPVNNEYVIYMLAENQSAEVAYNWKHYYIDN